MLFKARICLRGDMIHHLGEFSTSAPTAARVSPRLLTTISRIYDWEVSLVDISQAFLQSDLLIPSQRVLLVPPPYIPCPWKGDLCDARNGNAKDNVYLTLKPLYGTKCAPLRWYNKLTSTFVSFEWKPLSTDPCVYRLFRLGKMQALCVVHVDDILFTGSPEGKISFLKVLDSFQNSGVTVLSCAEPLCYLGLDITMVGNCIQLSQKTYAHDKLEECDLSDVFQEKLSGFPKLKGEHSPSKPLALCCGSLKRELI